MWKQWRAKKRVYLLQASAALVDILTILSGLFYLSLDSVGIKDSVGACDSTPFFFLIQGSLPAIMASTLLCNCLQLGILLDRIQSLWDPVGYLAFVRPPRRCLKLSAFCWTTTSALAYLCYMPSHPYPSGQRRTETVLWQGGMCTRADMLLFYAYCYLPHLRQFLPSDSRSDGNQHLIRLQSLKMRKCSFRICFEHRHGRWHTHFFFMSCQTKKNVALEFVFLSVAGMVNVLLIGASICLVVLYRKKEKKQKQLRKAKRRQVISTHYSLPGVL